MSSAPVGTCSVMHQASSGFSADRATAISLKRPLMPSVLQSFSAALSVGKPASGGTLGEEGLGRKLEASTTEAFPAQPNMHIRQRLRLCTQKRLHSKVCA